MKENKIMLLCILSLSVSIVFSSVYIGNAISSRNIINVADKAIYNKVLMTDKETAEYLNLQLDTFGKLVIMNDTQRKQVSDGGSSYDAFSYIPHIKIDGVNFYNKGHVDKWVEYNSLNNQEIETDIK